MQKGERTRDAILQQAVDLASVVGLNGLTIGSLATHMGMSKSGLFQHFGSKEALQVSTLEYGVGLFTEQVVRPALKQPRGVERVRNLFDSWLGWDDHTGAQGGCLFVTASIELDDQAGPARDFLVTTQQDWLTLLERTAQLAVEAHAFRPDLDCTQFAHELNSLLLGFHQSKRLMRDPKAESRARKALDRLIEDSRNDPSAS